MNQSEQINELASALAKAQGEIKPALKDSSNPFFKSKYADLASIWEACKTPLTKNGLAVLQSMDSRDGDMMLITTLVHSSGQWMKSVMPIRVKAATEKQNEIQMLGSAITYMRRYCLAALVGVTTDDDDGNAMEGSNGSYSAEKKTAEAKKASLPTIDKSQAKELSSLAGACDPNYLTNILLYMRNNFNSDKFEMLPVSHYEKIRNGLVKNVEEFAKKPAA